MNTSEVRNDADTEHDSVNISLAYICKARQIIEVQFAQLDYARKNRAELEQVIEEKYAIDLNCAITHANGDFVRSDIYQQLRETCEERLSAISLPALAITARNLAVACKNLDATERDLSIMRKWKNSHAG